MERVSSSDTKSDESNSAVHSRVIALPAKKLKIYSDIMSHPRGSPSRAVVWFCLANKIPYDLQVVKSPDGDSVFIPSESSVVKLPSIKDGDQVLYDSHNILRYLVTQFNLPEHWYPKEVHKRTRIERFLDWDHLGLRKAVAGLVWAKVFGTRLLTPQLIQQAEKECSRAIRALSVWLRDGPFFTGDKASIADVSAASELAPLYLIDYNFSATPRVAEFMEAASKLPGYSQAHQSLFAMRKKYSPSSITSKL